ncbi:uncharacterized protein PHALS_11172 [Plasmopara halstedii]|uniref:Uncharacterized protein n=1 Tax=Plasmopara halstedii TaxID=4781 RepID=A0A0P1AK31_PLAHL|nr:uncharacterized protein PHALS_11172 [Plasmopara halstedii]CEG41002.1 hypothetical protein PHALS_11172 [Plasmopara halstedii]|eukprot:XP_024577371.1 hypothetical protein PHALS_11172 [Plasmopara halstedii]
MDAAVAPILVNQRPLSIESIQIVEESVNDNTMDEVELKLNTRVQLPLAREDETPTAHELADYDALRPSKENRLVFRLRIEHSRRSRETVSLLDGFGVGDE